MAKKKAKTVESTAPVIVHGFKGFDANMLCRGKQYEVGKTYEEDSASLCNKGLHFCEHPLDCFSYYPPATSVYAEVEAENPNDETDSDTKRVTKKLTVKGTLGISELVKAAVDFVIEENSTATAGDGAHSATAGDGAHSATAGDGAHSATAGDGAHSATAGDGAHSATAGDGANSATAGDGANSATAGYGAHSATAGDGANSATAGYGANSATAGYGANSACLGDFTEASVSGENAIAASFGFKGKAKASSGSWIVLAERNDDRKIITVRCAKAGDEVKADTSYTLKNGEFVEA